MKKGKGKARSRPKHRKSKDDVLDDPDTCLGPMKSPLYDENMNTQEILDHPIAQSILRAEPGLSSEESQRAIADFKEDGRNGRHDADWLWEALQASESRAAGIYEEYDKYQFRETYGSEREELSDTESEAEAEAETDSRIVVDPVSPPKEDNNDVDNVGDSNVGDGKDPSHLSTHGTVDGLAKFVNESAPENDSGGFRSNTQENDTSNGDRENHENFQDGLLD